MGIPSIGLYAKDDTATVSTWAVGTVKADTVSAQLEVHVWNNYKGTTAGTNMIECTVGAFDGNGKDVDPIAADKWIQVNVNDEKDSSSNPVFTAIGGTTTAAIRGLGHAAVSGDPVTGDVIEGIVNDGAIATTASQAAVAKCLFQIAVPTAAAPGTTGFKIRFQGYYV